MRQAHGDHHDTPHEHDKGDENTGSKALEKDIGQGFEEGVGDEKDGEAGIVLTARYVETLLKAVKLRVPDIRSVQKADKVEEAEPWDETKVELPQEFLVLCEQLKMRSSSLNV